MRTVPLLRKRAERGHELGESLRDRSEVLGLDNEVPIREVVRAA